MYYSCVVAAGMFSGLSKLPLTTFGCPEIIAGWGGAFPCLAVPFTEKQTEICIAQVSTKAKCDHSQVLACVSRVFITWDVLECKMLFVCMTSVAGTERSLFPFSSNTAFKINFEESINRLQSCPALCLPGVSLKQRTLKHSIEFPFPSPPKKTTNNREKPVTLATDRSLVSSASRSQILNLQAKFEIGLVTNSGQGDGNLWLVESFWFPGTGTGTSSFDDVVSSRLFILHSANSANWSHSAIRCTIIC
jgi:hypothetical protein